MSRLNVLIYSGSGVSSTSRDYALQSLKTYLSHAYDVQLASTKVLQEGHWTSSCALLVFPGGRDLPFMHDLAGAPNRRIREYVEQGGAYLGFCAGAYYGSSNVEFQVGDKILEVVGERELGFYKGVCRGTTFAEPPFEYDSEKGARECRVELERNVWRDYWEQSPGGLEVYYNGGGAFYSRIEGEEERGVEVLARYGDVEGKPAAGVCCTVGEGRAILWGVHPEHPLMDPGSGQGKEERRQGLLRATLAMLRLDVSASPARPPHLLPLFLTSPDSTILSHTAKALVLARGENASLQDRNDTFVLHPMSDLNQVVTAALTRPRTFDPEELKERPKDVILCDPVPDVKLTPLFDIPLYFSLLAKARGSTTPLFGDTMLYSETVTSTQTMLDKNDKFLSCLPTGLVCLASHQVAGRGRGGNSWVSPAGCLQFSLVLRVPISQSRKIVFVQYLFGLAVVEAVRGIEGYGEVGVRVKWPNDIYGETDEGLRKVGGILVNSSYAGQDFTLVVGCGINTSNPKPTTSLNELIALHNKRTGSTLAPLRPEFLLSIVLAQFEKMWNPFLAAGFEPFMDRYLQSWIHTDQRVTIESTSQVVRIVGITPDHGLLRTVAITLDREGNEMRGREGKEFVDLQPGGHGFDMLHGLLVSRST